MWRAAPHEPVVRRLLVGMEGGTLGLWADRLFAPDVVLRLDSSVDTETPRHVGACAVAQVWSALMRREDGRLRPADVHVDLVDDAGWMAYRCESATGDLIVRLRVELRFANGRIAEARISAT
ncbi:MAG: hypothetical protein U0Q12_18410 [Vicinamibacterales bacterium]